MIDIDKFISSKKALFLGRSGGILSASAPISGSQLMASSPPLAIEAPPPKRAGAASYLSSDRLLTRAEIRQTVKAAGDSRTKSSTGQEILGVSIIGGLIGGAVILGDAGRRWYKSGREHAATTPARVSGKTRQAQPTHIPAPCPHGCAH